jgi:hypothetical protein
VSVASGPAVTALTLILAFVIAGCSGSPNLLGGRERCWPEGDTRLATLMKGRLELGAFPWQLDTPEGESFALEFAGPRLDPTATSLVDATGRTVATEGEMVTLFGGLGSDGVIVVCAIEERHPG